MDVFYLDISKAFDIVSQRVLLKKLSAHGLDGCLLGKKLDVQAKGLL